jgi:hypothetical protein
VKQTVRVILPDGTDSRYVLEEERNDGAILLRPDTSYAAISERAPGRDLTADEWQAFLAEHGPHMLPPDGEG